MALRGDRYELLRPIASGGMATVHLARALGEGGFERLVAIKTMHPHLAGEPQFVAMFLDEARLAARIRHPNVVSTLDVRTDDQGVFLVMEYIEGPSLDKVLRTMFNTQKQIPIEISIKICLDALAGLHAAHELRDSSGAPLNLVHRDVSPQNILIGTDGVARLTDFGVARAEERLSQQTRTGQVKGKVSYMSPEQAIGAAIDRRTDIYAAGIVLWEALTHQRLIREPNELLALLRVKEGNHKSPREFDALIPAAISDACMVALHKNPDERYPTAAAFAEALEHAAAEDGLAIATSRAVGAFITACQAHQPAANLPPAPAHVHTPPAAAPPPANVPSGQINPSNPVIRPSTPASIASSSPSSASATVATPSPSPAVTTSASTTSDVHASASPPRARRSTLAIAVGVAAFAIVAIFTFTRSADNPTKATNESEWKQLPSKPSAAVVVPVVQPLDPVSPVVPTATASASSAPVVTTTPVTVPIVKSVAKPAETAPTKTSPVYRPPEL